MHCQAWVLHNYFDYDFEPLLWAQYQKILDDEIPEGMKRREVEWADFIAEAQQSQVVVATGELSPHGSIILEAGLEGGGGGTGGTSPTTMPTTNAPGGTGVYFWLRKQPNKS